MTQVVLRFASGENIHTHNTLFFLQECKLKDYKWNQKTQGTKILDHFPLIPPYMQIFIHRDAFFLRIIWGFQDSKEDRQWAEGKGDDKPKLWQ